MLELDVTTALFTVALGYIIYFCIQKTSKISTKTKAKYPVATSSILENIRELTSNKVPLFLVDTMRKLKSDFYKISLPFLPGGGFYVIGDQNAAREILKDKDTDKPFFMYEPMHMLLGGPSMFSYETSNPKWHVARKCASPAFSSGEVRRMNSVCKSNLSSWIENELDEKISRDETFDPSLEMTWLTFGVILEAAFEYSDATRNEYMAFHTSLEDGLREFIKGADPLRRFYRFLLPSGRRAFQATKILHALSAKILESYRTNKNKSENNTIIKLIENNPQFSEDEKIREILILLVAGHDTTGYALSTTLILMAKHPEFAVKLKADVEKYGIGASRYSKCVIQECMRFMPVAATGSVRTVGKDFTFKDGSIVIPKGSTAWIPFIMMFRNEKYFEDPDTFNPDRWLNATGTMKSAFMPFSLGNRDCIGQRLANAELDYCVPYLFSNYKFEIVEKGDPDYFMTWKYAGTKLKATKIA